MPVKRRSSFSGANAMRFKEIFDDAIATHADIRIKIRGSPSSFHTKCSDALKWLMLYNDFEHQDSKGRLHKQDDYKKLRGEIKFKYTEQTDSVRLAFYTNDRSLVPEHFVLEPSPQEQQAEEKLYTDRTDPTIIRSRLISEFIERIQHFKTTGAIYELRDIKLSPDEEIWVKNILKQIEGLTYIVEEDMVICKFEKSNPS